MLIPTRGISMDYIKIKTNIQQKLKTKSVMLSSPGQKGKTF